MPVPERIPPLRIIPLPAIPTQITGVFWQVTEPFIDELAAYLKGRRVLEVFAGNGYLTGCLAQRGANIRATSLLNSYDRHEHGLYADVEEMHAETALARYGEQSDVLLMSWPTATLTAYMAAMMWGPGRDICYIGEITDHAEGRLGGCATDEFFAAVDVVHRFETYQGGSTDFAVVFRVR